MITERLQKIVFVCLIVFLCVLIIGPAVALQIADQNTTPTVEVTTTPDPESDETVVDEPYSFYTMIVVLALILLLGVLFYTLLLWSHRLEQASYLGVIYRDSVKDSEFRRLAAILYDKYSGPYNEYVAEVLQDNDWLQKNPPPPMGHLKINLYDLAFPRPEEYNPYDTSLGAYPLWDPGDTIGAVIRAERAALDDWMRQKVYKEAYERYLKERKEAREEAERRADLATKIDLGVFRGRGSEFVLEFTTVVVIIFAVIMLGTLGVLETEQIGTILAAIAGYVLGRASTRSRAGTETETKITPPPGKDIVDIINAVRGTAVPQGAVVSKEKIRPAIDWKTPDPIEEGTPLSETQLNARVSVDGTLEYDPKIGDVLAPGTRTLHVKFTPTDTEKYSTEERDVTIEIKKKSSVQNNGHNEEE